MTIILRHIPMSETRQILNKNDPTCQEMQYILNASDQINTKSRMHPCKIKLFLIQFSLFITKKFTHSTYEHKVIFILSKPIKWCHQYDKPISQNINFSTQKWQNLISFYDSQVDQIRNLISRSIRNDVDKYTAPMISYW